MEERRVSFYPFEGGTYLHSYGLTSLTDGEPFWYGRVPLDEEHLHHVLHSLAIAKFIEFKEGSTILDLGTGGGFPGVPLAILFPQVNFHLVDSINKKLNVVREVCHALNITNITSDVGRQTTPQPKNVLTISVLNESHFPTE